MNQIRINHSTIETDFIDHLRPEENNRILFTAPFGAGKSTFLQEVFKNNENNYFTINLFPVNYSVTANEDVFELIKFDLLLELLGKYKDDINLQKEDFSALLLSQMFILKELKLTPIILAILRQCGKIGKSAVDIIEEVKKQYDDFKERVTDDESENIFTFLNLIQDQKGSEYEMDSISTLIKDLVSRVKEKKGSSSVLIIDDLDRLDPEHTFRLINIFSAHFDKLDNSNKFGFDKVVFVCDFENIRKIFHHKFGAEVDFSGYSDKFFSLAPYQFDNRQFIKEKTGEIINQIKFDGNIAWLLHNDESFFLSTKALIQSLIDAGQLNLRMLFNYPRLVVPNFCFGKNKKFFQNTIEAPIVVIFYLLKNFYGSFDILQSKLKYLCERLNRNNLTSSNHELFFISDGERINKTIISYCLPFLLPEDIALQDVGTDHISTYSEEYDCILHFNSLNSRFPLKKFHKATKKDNDPEEVLLNPYQVLLDVFDICQKLGAFK